MDKMKRNHLPRMWVLLSLVLALAGMGGCREEIPAPPTRELRGVNIAHALEAPNEGDWGVVIREDYFDTIQQAGFNLVRIPVRFSAHAKLSAPYPFDEAFLRRIDQVVGQALDRGLTVILVMQGYDELCQDPAQHEVRFIAMWEQLAKRYAALNERCYFELLNEPYGELTSERWNGLASKAVAAIRRTNPSRKIVLGSVGRNAPEQLASLELPESGGNIIATFHYYAPYEFTHQGSSKDTMEHLGKLWTGTREEREAIRADFELAQAWANERNVDLLLGEFGTFEAANGLSRASWTKCVREEAEQLGFGWAYWDFCANFGLYDLERQTFLEGLYRALIP